MFGRSVQTCGGCGRGIPAGHRNCPRCARAGRSGTGGGTRAKGKAAPRRCGKRIPTGTCGGFVPAGGRCDRCGSS